jgi:hypothetical protein
MCALDLPSLDTPHLLAGTGVAQGSDAQSLAVVVTRLRVALGEAAVMRLAGRDLNRVYVLGDSRYCAFRRLLRT